MKELQIKTPPIGLTYSRANMPQLGPIDQFLEKLRAKGVKYKHVKVNSRDLKASQSEFNLDSVRSIINDPRPTKSAVVISSDNYIADGHHRVCANLTRGVMTKAIRVELPVLELLRLVKTFDTTQYRDLDHVRTIRSVVRESYAK